jgi:uncharacterized membrane protein YdfJ with MMPL/SSD domain
MRLFHDLARSLSAVRDVAAVRAIGSDENAIEPTIESMQHPVRIYPAGARNSYNLDRSRIVHMRATGQVDARVRDIVRGENQYSCGIAICFTML